MESRTTTAIRRGPSKAWEGEKLAIKRFAKLINASVDEIGLVPSTSYGENYVARGLDLGHPGDKVVTDILHFEGSLYLYENLSRFGLKHVIVPARDNRIDLNDMDKAITPGTKLVSVSYVSFVNGFQHDLKALCALAHSRGALVYADVIQAAGAVPLDVKAVDLDFCAASGFKWMMGEFGAGFLYVRSELLPKMKRFLFGYQQMAGMAYHAFPYDPPGSKLVEFTAAKSMSGHFAVGSKASAQYLALAESLGMIEALGVDAIQAHRQPLLRRLHEEMPKKGFVPLTPENSTSPIISFVCRNAYERYHEAIRKAGINIQLYRHRLRVSPSVYNSMDDIDRLLEALA